MVDAMHRVDPYRAHGGAHRVAHVLAKHPERWTPVSELCQVWKEIWGVPLNSRTYGADTIVRLMLHLQEQEIVVVSNADDGQMLLRPHPFAAARLALLPAYPERPVR